MGGSRRDQPPCPRRSRRQVQFRGRNRTRDAKDRRSRRSAVSNPRRAARVSRMKALDFAFVENGERVVVRLVPLVLKVDKQAREVADLDGERTRLPVAASLLRPTVVHGAVDAHPARLPAHIPAEQLIGTALGETVKQGVVGGAHGAPKVRLKRSAPAGGKEVPGRGEEVRRSQASGPWRRSWRRGACVGNASMPMSHRMSWMRVRRAVLGGGSEVAGVVVVDRPDLDHVAAAP